MVSTTIIAKNEEKFIAQAITSAHQLDGEVIVVVDEASNDKTYEIASKMQAKVFRRKFDNFASQKNYAASKAINDWIFSLDADEEITRELAIEIKKVITDTKFSGYKIPRLNYIFGKAIRHTNWGPKDDTHLWLYRKSQGKWLGDVHEEVKVDDPVGLLKNLKIHQNYMTVEEFIGKMNEYTTMENKSVNPLYDFLRRYIWHLGILDGWHGLFLSYLMMIYHLSVWVKLCTKKSSS